MTQFSVLWGEVGSNFTTASQSRCKLAVNAAYQEWMAAMQWSYREATVVSVPLVAGTAKYNLLGPSPVVTDFDGLISVGLEMNTGGTVEPMAEFLQPDFDRFCGRSKGNSQPLFYCVRGGAPQTTSGTITSGGIQQLHIAPPPLAVADAGQALQIAYFRSVGSLDMVADADVPLIPAQYHYALIVGGNAYMAEWMKNVQSAGQYRQLFQQRIQEAMIADQGLRGRDRVLLVPKSGPQVYGITGQTEPTFDPATRRYERQD